MGSMVEGFNVLKKKIGNTLSGSLIYFYFTSP